MRRPALALAATVAVSLLAGCSSGATSAAAPTTVTVTAPAPPAAATPDRVTYGAAPTAAPTVAAPTVTLPEVKGRNGGIVYEELQALGLTKLELASADKTHSVVLLPQNWTATKIEPAAGTKVRTDQTVVVTMTKGG